MSDNDISLYSSIEEAVRWYMNTTLDVRTDFTPGEAYRHERVNEHIERSIACTTIQTYQFESIVWSLHKATFHASALPISLFVLKVRRTCARTPKHRQRMGIVSEYLPWLSSRELLQVDSTTLHVSRCSGTSGNPLTVQICIAISPKVSRTLGRRM